MTKLELAHDGWAEIREPDQIPRKAAREFRKVLYKIAAPAADVDQSQDPDAAALEAAKALLASDGGMDGIEDMKDALVFAVVSEWSYGEVTQTVLDTMPDAAVEKIYDTVQSGGYIEKLMPDFTANPEGDKPDDPSPIGPSSG